MSKQRPSKGYASGLALWLRRVFHNSYTRDGKRIPVRGWSVKLQHGGTRRTLALASQTRQSAAAEARAIYDILCREGWEEVDRQFNKASGQTFPRTDVRYWQQRLLCRSRRGTGVEERQQELSARIEHAGSGWYFPLGVNEPEAASRRALSIYRTVIEKGWEVAKQLFRREVTLCFQWARDPLLWTYTTIHTVVGKSPVRSDVGTGRAPPQTGALRVIEDDPGIWRALDKCLQTEVAFFAGKDDRKPVLCLVNRELAGKTGLANPGRISLRPDGVPVLTYGVHADSEELFALTPGGMCGYILKRVPPDRLLEPVSEILTSGRMTEEGLVRSARSYFQRLLESDTSGDAPSTLARLSRREQDVLNLMSKGYLDKEIAPALGISVWTVHEHVKRIFEKLQVHSRTEASLIYLQK